MGITVAIGFHFEMTESENRTSLETQLTAEMGGLTHSLEGSQAWKYEDTRVLKRTTIKTVMYTDRPIEGNPIATNFTEIYSTLKRIPDSLKNVTNGVPIRYRLHDIDTVRSLAGYPKVSGNGTANTTPRAKKGLQQLQDQMLSVYYSNDANEQEYLEQVDRVSSFNEILPEDYGRTLKKRYRKYQKKFRSVSQTFKELIIIARSNYSDTVTNKLKRVMRRYKRSKHGPTSFGSFLLDLSRNVTEKVTDSKKLRQNGFTYVSKAETVRDVVISHGSEVIVILFISQDWRRLNFDRHAQCLLLGTQIQAIKYVYDCDFQFHQQTCHGTNDVKLVVYRHGTRVAEESCDHSNHGSRRIS